MVAEEALITPDVVKWARERMALDYEAVARRISKTTSPKLVADWEDGKEKPSMAQAEKMAKALYVPFGYLFLPRHPIDTLAIPDFRTLPGGPILTGNLVDLIDSVVLKHDWYKDFLSTEGEEPKKFVGSYSDKGSDPVSVAADIRRVIGISNDLRASCRTSQELLGKIVKRAESVGVVVMRSRHVNGHRNRRIRVKTEGFRGFAISDPLAPLIFINTDDAKAAQLFTMAHELAHVWIGRTGISNEDVDALLRSQINTEYFCNAVAAEVLVPSEEMLDVWDNRASASNNINRVRAIFKVSALVAIRRAFDIGRISRDTYQALFSEAVKYTQESAPVTTKKKGNSISTLMARNSRTLTSALLIAAKRERITYREAGAMLNLKPATIYRLANRTQEL